MITRQMPTNASNEQIHEEIQDYVTFKIHALITSDRFDFSL